MEIASRSQLRLAFLRWAVVTVPFVLLLGFASARLAPSGSDNGWYVALAKPQATPPDWMFGAAWTILYIMLGLALAMVINARGSRLRTPALILFALQMALNLAWTPLFFGAHQVVPALILIAVLFVLALATLIVFAQVRIGAAALMVPYLLWIAFAGYLLFEINALNPGAADLVPASSTTQIVIPE